eukprot:jgi/Mesen1/5471/ME000275S04788
MLPGVFGSGLHLQHLRLRSRTHAMPLRLTGGAECRSQRRKSGGPPLPPPLCAFSPPLPPAPSPDPRTPAHLPPQYLLPLPPALCLPLSSHLVDVFTTLRASALEIGWKLLVKFGSKLGYGFESAGF